MSGYDPGSMGLFHLLIASRRNLVRAFALVQNRRVPLRLKLLALGAALLILSPLNVFGDIPLLGIVDDAALFALLLGWFVRSAGPYGDDTSKHTLTVSR